MKSPLIFAAVAMVPALYGCASLSEQDCLASDWQAIGYEDGVRGYSAARVAQHREACSKHGVSLDAVAYRNGRREGLMEFCRPENAFQLGARGGAYNGVCPKEAADEFSTAYYKGRRLYDLEAGISNASTRISSKQSRLESIETALAANSVRIVSAEATVEERAKLLVDTRHMLAERDDLEEEIAQLRKERSRKKRKLDAYRTKLAGVH